MKFLEHLTEGPLTLAELLLAIREGEGMTQSDFAKHLGISKSHLCDIEKGRKTVSLSRSVKFAKKLGYSERQFVRLALQALVDENGLNFKINVEAA